MLIRVNSQLTILANKMPKSHKSLIKFFSDNAKHSTMINIEDVYHWAYDVNLVITCIATTNIVSNKNRLDISEEQKELIRNINAIKRSLKFELHKLMRTTIAYCDVDNFS